MMKGRMILKRLQEMSGETTEIYTYRNTGKKTPLSAMEFICTKRRNNFWENSLISRLQSGAASYQTIQEVRERLKPTHPCGAGDWVDLSGLFAPKSEVDRLIELIERPADKSE
ncbi:hypothetical protein MASR1M31_07140 [Porphyromonadaceae bacterium]